MSAASARMPDHVEGAPTLEHMFAERFAIIGRMYWSETQPRTCLIAGGDVHVHAELRSFSITEILGRPALAAYAEHESSRESGIFGAVAGN